MWPTSPLIKAIGSQGDANEEKHEFCYLHYITKHHQCQMLPWWWLRICTYPASPCWHCVTSSQFHPVESVLALFLRTKSFIICPSPKQNEMKNITIIGLSKEELWKINPTIKLSKIKLWKINPIVQKLHHTTPLVCIHKTCKAPW